MPVPQAANLTPVRSPPRPGPWLTDVAVVVVMALVLVAQQPGRTRFDTKLDLWVDPWGFLTRALDAWDSSAGFGQLQNQAYGYLFPMGPVIGVFHGVGLPTWVAQAVWAWLLLAGAYVGMRLLLRQWQLPWFAAVPAAVAYACAPRHVTVVGPLSAELIAAALLPFSLLALARGAGTLRRTAACAALPFLLMGAANAAVTLAVTPLPALVILTRRYDRWRLLGWWSFFVGLMSVWWVVPLLVQRNYAVPFLDNIESARITSSGLLPAEVLRGDVHWVGGIVSQGRPWWPAGYQYSVVPWLVTATLLLAAIGVAGLASRHVPERVALASAALLGAVLMGAGSTLAPFAAGYWDLLDGPLVPFRNVHKFDPLIRLPLAVGVAVAVLAVAQWVASRSRPRLGPLVGAGVAGLAVVVALPLAVPGVSAGRTWTRIPDWWQASADWLAADGGGRALVVPGSGFGIYLWGRTIDEPLQPLARSPWAIATGLPLGSIGSARLLDSVSAALRAGRAVPGLADTLARSGVAYVVVRNDVDSAEVLGPSRSVVAATLLASPGFSPAASFGDSYGSWRGDVSTDFGRDDPRPASEIYRVDGDVPLVSATAVSGTILMTGGPESLLPATASGLLPADRPVVFEQDVPTTAGAWGSLPLIQTDGLMRRDRALGRGDEDLSSAQSADEASRVDRRSPDLLPWPEASLATVAYRGIRSVEASSARSYADSIGSLLVARSPAAAVDGDLTTWWQSSGFGGPVGQWWQVMLRRPSDLRGMTVLMNPSPLIGSAPRRVALVADGTTVTARVSGSGVVGPLNDPALRDVLVLRIRVHEADGSSGDAAIREITLPGLTSAAPVLVPAPTLPSTGVATLSLAALAPARPACVTVGTSVSCDPSQAREDAAGGVLDRLVQVTDPISGPVRVWGTLRAGPSAAALLDPIGDGITARASSWLSFDVRARPSAAVDGDPQTLWVADPQDPRPWIDLRWPRPRTITEIKLEQPSDGQGWSRPTGARVSVRGRNVPVLSSGTTLVPIEPLRTDRLRLMLAGWDKRVTVNSRTSRPTSVPPAIGEVRLTGAEDLVYRPDPTSRTGSICGFGPDVTVGGTTVRTRVVGTLGDVMAGNELIISPCSAPLTSVRLSPGAHRLVVGRSDLVVPTRVSLGRAASQPEQRPVEAQRWDTSRRSVVVDPGPEALLRVAESANAGWTAMLDGERLPPVQVDGWQQGWVVPAGSGGVVELTYAPTATQKSGLAVGLLTALLALVIGFARPGSGGGYRTESRPGVQRGWAAVVVVPAGLLLAGATGGVVAVLALLVAGHRWAPLTAFVAVASAGALVVAAALGAPVPPVWISFAALGGLLIATCGGLLRHGAEPPRNV
jgi:arabinofuranan 3-O-arabinosyltransferase